MKKAIIIGLFTIGIIGAGVVTYSQKTEVCDTTECCIDDTDCCMNEECM